MKAHLRSLRLAFPHTLPVLTGYLFLGFGFGVLMSAKGYSLGLIFVMSLTCLAGALQYFAVTLLGMPFNPAYTVAMTLMINARHMFYGIPLLDKFRGTGKYKPYLIFGLTDETFSLLCSVEPPEGEDRTRFMFYITLLDHLYWIAGGLLGGIIGALIEFNTEGLDFVLTALFVLIFINQWRSPGASHLSALVGVGGTALCLILFGPDRFLIPAMALMLVLLTLLRRRIEKGGEHQG